MQLVIVAPCLLPHPPVNGGTTPPQLAMHLAACTPVRHRVRILDRPSAARSGAEGADLYVLLWSDAFSPRFIEIALQLASCDPFVCVWDGPTPAPVEYVLEFCDQVVYTAQGDQWQHLLETIEREQRQLA